MRFHRGWWAYMRYNAISSIGKNGNDDLMIYAIDISPK
jgi:hypothetical protein